MWKHGSSYYIEPALQFEILGAIITATEMAQFVAKGMRFDSEHDQEHFVYEMSWAIFNGVTGKVNMASAQSERTRVRRLWVELHPPNHAGYYYCHVGSEWVHIDAAELDHIIPSSVERINTDEPGWDRKLRMACHDHNYQKGSSIVESKTLEIAPPDGEL